MVEVLIGAFNSMNVTEILLMISVCDHCGFGGGCVELTNSVLRCWILCDIRSEFVCWFRI